MFLKILGITRFFLAIGVVAYHSGFGGYGGVYMLYGFYLISGYVIAKAIQESYMLNKHWIIIFYLKRFLRLIPSFLLASIIFYIAFLGVCNLSTFEECMRIPLQSATGITVSTFSFKDLAQGILPSLILKTDPLQIVTFFSFLSPFWSVSLEMMFYLLIPFLFVFPEKKWSFLGVTCLTFFIYCYYAIYLVGVNEIWKWMDIVYLNFIPNLFFFLLGVMVSRLSLRVPACKGGRLIQRICHVFAVIGILTVLILSREVNLTPQNYLIHHHLLLFMTVVVVVVVLLVDRLGFQFSSFDHFLGNLSYPIYLNHMTCIMLVLGYETIVSNGGDLPSYIKIPTVVVSTLVLSLIFHFCFESRITRLRRKIK